MSLKVKSLTILKFCILFSVLHMVGCTTSKQIEAKETEALNSWIGSTKARLIQSWGAPTRTESDGQGGEILVYEDSRKIANVVYGTYMEKTISNYKEMFVNTNGKIYHWRSGRR
jgi:hypothetical protein